MTLLILGGTGTLGRQVVMKALNEGFHVKCLVRNIRKASFLREWGAELIYGDLALPETIPLALLKASALIDCSTNRYYDTNDIKLTDLKAKYILIDAAIKANVKRFIFFSIVNSINYSNIALVRFKLMVELRLRQSDVKYTVFYLPGFFQGLISQYALPILDQQAIWMTSESSLISYINTQDIAKMVIQSLSIAQFTNISVPLVGAKSWKSIEVIKLCEQICGRRAKINKISIYSLNYFKYFMRFFKWSSNIADRLDFIQIISQEYNTNVNMEEVLHILKVKKENLESLELYLQEYFARVMGKLKELNYQSFNNHEDSNKPNF